MRFLLAGPWRFWLIIVVVLPTVFVVWMSTENSLPRGEAQRNVIIIAIGDMRADHLGTYGYREDTSPNIDEFAREGVFFEHAFLQGVRSSMSFASLFTSQYPRANGVVFVDQELASSKTTLTEVLDNEGYKTGAFVESSQLLREYGITQGFSLLRVEANDKDLLASASSWIQENASKPLFLFLERSDETMFHSPEPYEHYFDSEYAGVLSDHSTFYFSLNPSQYPNAILPKLKAVNGQAVLRDGDKEIVLSKRDVEHLISHYDDGVRHADSFFKQALDMLKQNELYNNSTIIFLTDHGETLDDHLGRDQMRNIQLTGHAQVYDEIIHSPLIIKSPDLKPGRISSQVQFIDLFPTILEILHMPQGKELSGGLQGKSLVPLLSGVSRTEEYVYGQSEAVQNIIFIRSSRWKLMVWPNGQLVLYDLQKDPGETRNVLDQNYEIAEQLNKKLSAWYLDNVKLKLERDGM